MDPTDRNRSPEDRHDSEGRGAFSVRRRALIRAGAGAAPVLLTLTSRPVQAANSCVVASSFVSVATFRSRNPTSTTINCTSLACEDWLKLACLPESGPVGAEVRPTYLSVTVSTFLGSTTSSYGSWPLWQVLKNDTTGIVKTGALGVLQHLISMALNIQQNKVSMPGNVNLPYLQGVWQNYNANGGRYRLPQSGIDWDSSGVISWLRMLMYPM